MERLDKINILEQIANGQASIKDLKEKHMVHRIFAPGKGINGLYVNGELSSDETDSIAFIRAFSKGLVKIHHT